jgi:uncharacterized phage protein (TIGR02218 family)
MRGNDYNFSGKHERLINSRYEISFTYLYEIYLFSGAVLKLNSSGQEIVANNEKFLPFSSIILTKGEFNDSAENIINLTGIFETNGIDKKMNLAGCKIKIFYYYDKVLFPIVTYFITEFIKNDLDFTLKCEPETTKYNQSLLLLYSKTCRANFGDSKCAIDTSRYRKLYRIQSIKSRIISVSDMELNSGYYNLGRASFLTSLGENISFRIIAHYNNQIILEEEVYEDLLKHKEVSLVPTCDKNFRTCCNKFNNAVNFRGEPTITKHSFLKNNAL